MFDEYEYRITSNQYVEEVQTDKGKFCYFMIGLLGSFSTPSAILGDAFIRNYYIYHDIENKRIGLHGDYMEYFKPESRRWFYFIIFGILGVVIIVAFSLYYATREKQEILNLSKQYEELLNKSAENRSREMRKIDSEG